MPEIKIGDRLVGDGQPTYIIAEIGVNHNGFLDLALKLIDVAVDAGADAVKFQKRNLDNLYAKKYLDNANAGEKTLRYLLPILQQVELSDDAYYEIVEYCRKKGITFLCSAFDAESADFLETLGVPAYKVASADLTNLPLLDHLAQKGKPLILSTGMSRMEEVEITVDFLKERQRPVCSAALQQHLSRCLRRYQPALHEPTTPLRSSGWLFRSRARHRSLDRRCLPWVPASSNATSPWTARWMVLTMQPAWNRKAFRRWCAISAR